MAVHHPRIELSAFRVHYLGGPRDGETEVRSTVNGKKPQTIVVPKLVGDTIQVARGELPEISEVEWHEVVYHRTLRTHCGATIYAVRP